MSENSKSKLTPWMKVLLIIGIIVVVGFRVAIVAAEVNNSTLLYIIKTLPSLFTTHSFYDEAGVWSGDGITIENSGELVELEDGASYNGIGTVTLDGVTYDVVFQLARSQSCVFAYNKETFHEWEGLESDGDPSNDSLMWTFDVREETLKGKVTITVHRDYLSSYKGMTDHTGETFVLYRQ